jgi:hypothetical protein
MTVRLGSRTQQSRVEQHPRRGGGDRGANHETRKNRRRSECAATSGNGERHQGAQRSPA